MSIIQDHHFIKGLFKKIPFKYREQEVHLRKFVVVLEVNIEVALAKCLQKHYFGTEYAIRLLPSDDQHAKDGVCGKKW